MEVLFILEKPNFCPEVQAIFYAKYEKCVNSIYVCQEKIFVSRKYLSQGNFSAKKNSVQRKILPKQNPDRNKIFVPTIICHSKSASKGPLEVVLNQVNSKND